MSKQKQFMYTSCSPDVLSLQFSIFMNNLSSYCGLVNAKIRASDIDLPVLYFAGALFWQDSSCDFLWTIKTASQNKIMVIQKWFGPREKNCSVTCE